VTYTRKEFRKHISFDRPNRKYDRTRNLYFWTKKSKNNSRKEFKKHGPFDRPNREDARQET
jgi:hypothetical protein